MTLGGALQNIVTTEEDAKEPLNFKEKPVGKDLFAISANKGKYLEDSIVNQLKSRKAL